MIFYIYTLKHPETLKVVYVGCTSNTKARLASHRTVYSWKYKYEPIMSVIEQHDCNTKAKNREWELIKFYNNISPLNQNCKQKMTGRSPISLVRDRRIKMQSK